MPQDRITVPLAEEQLVTGRREHESGRVRIRTHVVEEEVQAEDRLVEEEVSVERHQIGRVIDEIPPIREEGPLLIIPVVEERVVSEVRLVLVEEIRILRERITSRESRPVILRREVAEIEHIPPSSEGKSR